MYSPNLTAALSLFHDCLIMAEGFLVTFEYFVAQWKDGVLFVKGPLIVSLCVVLFLFLAGLFWLFDLHDVEDWDYLVSV